MLTAAEHVSVVVQRATSGGLAATGPTLPSSGRTCCLWPQLYIGHPEPVACMLYLGCDLSGVDGHLPCRWPCDAVGSYRHCAHELWDADMVSQHRPLIRCHCPSSSSLRSFLAAQLHCPRAQEGMLLQLLLPAALGPAPENLLVRRAGPDREAGAAKYGGGCPVLHLWDSPAPNRCELWTSRAQTAPCLSRRVDHWTAGPLVSLAQQLGLDRVLAGTANC
eukprot:SAG22_NODE_205_length_15308_cov_20.539023_24_plen_220_part_00